MTIKCKLCAHVMNSDRADAPDHLTRTMIDHLKRSHQEHISRISAAFTAVTGLAFSHLVFKYVEIPASETVMQQAYDENKNGLYEMLEAELKMPKPAKAGTLH